jgi:branched-chain amino acid transport system ATP-binding protein
MSAILAVDGLAKHYGAIRAVDGVSFAVEPGEIFGVIGPNGSGKTTMFNAVLGQIRPDAGSVTFAGENVTGAGPLALSRRGIGRTFQSLQVFGGLSVRDNVIAAAQEHHGSLLNRLFAAPDAGLGQKADETLAFFELAPHAKKLAGGLSYGQQKLLDIAMAFMADPKLVMLDEPAAGVNPRLIDTIRDLLLRLNRERGTTFVVIEHNMDFVMSLCRRILVLAEGKVLALGSPAAIRANPAVLEAYLGG